MFTVCGKMIAFEDQRCVDGIALSRNVYTCSGRMNAETDFCLCQKYLCRFARARLYNF